MDPRRVKSLLGEVAAARGRSAEERVVEALALPSRPAWIHDARRATKAEDHAGIDAVVESDVGKLFVQVKSSRTGKAKFQERKRSVRVAVVVVGGGGDAEAVRRKVGGELGKVRAEYVKERRGPG
jgi:hypothetical protein